MPIGLKIFLTSAVLFLLACVIATGVTLYERKYPEADNSTANQLTGLLTLCGVIGCPLGLILWVWL
jgi:hypothetical protein